MKVPVLRNLVPAQVLAGKSSFNSGNRSAQVADLCPQPSQGDCDEFSSVSELYQGAIFGDSKEAVPPGSDWSSSHALAVVRRDQQQALPTASACSASRRDRSRPQSLIRCNTGPSALRSNGRPRGDELTLAAASSERIGSSGINGEDRLGDG